MSGSVDPVAAIKARITRELPKQSHLTNNINVDNESSKSNFGNTQGDSDDLAKRQRRDASSDRQRRTPSSKYSTSVSNPQKIRSSDRFSTKWNWEAIFFNPESQVWVNPWMVLPRTELHDDEVRGRVDDSRSLFFQDELNESNRAQALHELIEIAINQERKPTATLIRDTFYEYYTILRSSKPFTAWSLLLCAQYFDRICHENISQEIEDLKLEEIADLIGKRTNFNKFQRHVLSIAPSLMDSLSDRVIITLAIMKERTLIVEALSDIEATGSGNLSGNHYLPVKTSDISYVQLGRLALWSSGYSKIHLPNCTSLQKEDGGSLKSMLEESLLKPMGDAKEIIESAEKRFVVMGLESKLKILRKNPTPEKDSLVELDVSYGGTGGGGHLSGKGLLRRALVAVGWSGILAADLVGGRMMVNKAQDVEAIVRIGARLDLFFGNGASLSLVCINDETIKTEGNPASV